MLASPSLVSAQKITIEFDDGKVGARVTDGAGSAPRPAAPSRRRDGGGNQGSLL